MHKNIAFIELGGNKGNRLNLLAQSKELMAREGMRILAQSSIYETPPWGFQADQNFYNQVVKIETQCNPIDLFAKLQIIEKQLGRTRGKERYESRTVDMDILFFNTLVVNEKNLIIPHPRLHLRKFVLVPMNEIASQLIHPVLKVSIHQLLTDCDDASTCKKVTN